MKANTGIFLDMWLLPNVYIQEFKIIFISFFSYHKKQFSE
jgi:hypothetical protein